MAGIDPLLAESATKVRGRLLAGEITPLELLDLIEQRIAAVDPMVNALPTLCFERARAAAAELMRRPADERGVLAGLPVAVKDLVPVAGVRTTFGSPIFSDFVPTASDCQVDTIEANGGIVYAKTNTPEFGSGANTFNEVFGRTLNPWDTRMSSAGSSGGSAVALATGCAWLATGSDLGGSLRNPASFCSVVGLRPSPGRVAQGAAGAGAYPHELGAWINQPFAVSGPMARDVEDVALMLDAMSGYHRADPLSLPREHPGYIEALARREPPRRVAFSRDLGVTPVDPEVAAICERAARRFESLGCEVEEAHPDCSDVQDIFHTNRAIDYYLAMKGLLATRRALLKPEVVWNIERAREVGLDDIARVENARAAYVDRATRFFDEFDLLLSPATIVPPFPVEQRYVEECGGHRFANYIEWCTIAYAITVTGFPALSVPAGFTAAGLPVGLQMVAPLRAEARLLAAARCYEEAGEPGATTPIDPRTPRE